MDCRRPIDTAVLFATLGGTEGRILYLGISGSGSYTRAVSRSGLVLFLLSLVWGAGLLFRCKVASKIVGERIDPARCRVRIQP